MFVHPPQNQFKISGGVVHAHTLVGASLKTCYGVVDKGFKLQIDTNQ